VAELGGGGAGDETDGVPAVRGGGGVAEEDLDGRVDRLQQLLVGVVGSVRDRVGEAEADEGGLAVADEPEVGVGGDLLGEPVGPGDVAADVRAQALEAVVAEDEPELERPEASPSGICQSR
jgi:hypothetical protein